MYVVKAGEIGEFSDAAERAVRTLEQAFAQVCCRAGCTYHFEQEQESWRLVLTDGERPECSPEPITSTYIKRADAIRDLMTQAVDGRLKGYVAIPMEVLQQHHAFIASVMASE